MPTDPPAPVCVPTGGLQLIYPASVCICVFFHKDMTVQEAFPSEIISLKNLKPKTETKRAQAQPG